MPEQLILIEKHEDIGKITFNNGALNILNIPMMVQINEALVEFLKDESLKAVIISNNGKAFSAGVDIGDHMGDKAKKMLEVFHDIFRNLNKMKCPTIASVKGAALGGGCEVALFCDIVIASERAKFGQPEIKVGVFPPVSAVILPFLMGKKESFEFLLQGETMDVNEARRLGLVNRIFPSESYEQEFTNYINRFKKLSTVVLQQTKKAINLGINNNFEAKLDLVEKQYLEELMATHDANEGLNAFMEKRKPKWQNK
ncbi:MAG: enoyl-CoA hydratase/isomerase family protein [Candidatus Hodarchaeales archaeon]